MARSSRLQCRQYARQDVIGDRNALICDARERGGEFGEAQVAEGLQDFTQGGFGGVAGAGLEFLEVQPRGKAEPEDGTGGDPLLGGERFELRDRELWDGAGEGFDVMGEAAGVFPLGS